MTGKLRRAVLIVSTAVLVVAVAWFLCVPTIMYGRLEKSCLRMMDGFAQRDIMAVSEELYEQYEGGVFKEHFDMIYGRQKFAGGYEMELSERGRREEGGAKVYTAKYNVTTEAGTWEMYAETAFQTGGLFNVRVGDVEMEMYEPDIGGNNAPEVIIFFFGALSVFGIALATFFSNEFMARFGKKWVNKGNGWSLRRGGVSYGQVYELDDIPDEDDQNKESESARVGKKVVFCVLYFTIGVALLTYPLASILIEGSTDMKDICMAFIDAAVAGDAEAAHDVFLPGYTRYDFDRDFEKITAYFADVEEYSVSNTSVDITQENTISMYTATFKGEGDLEGLYFGIVGYNGVDKLVGFIIADKDEVVDSMVYYAPKPRGMKGAFGRTALPMVAGMAFIVLGIVRAVGRYDGKKR